MGLDDSLPAPGISRFAGMSQWIPDQYVEFQDLCVDLFSKDYKGSMKHIDAELDKNERLISKLSRIKNLKNTNAFDSLFSFDVPTVNTDIESSQEEDDLR